MRPLFVLQVEYPDDLPEDAADLIFQMLQKALSRRLGNMAGGYQDIKDHPFCEVRLAS